MLTAREGSTGDDRRVSEQAFDRLMDAFDQPVVVVTAASRRAGAACVVSFSSRCSVDPPRYCVWIPKAHAAHDVVRRAGHAMVHFLDRRQRDLAAAVTTAHGLADGADEDDGGDAFAAAAGAAAGLRWRPGPDGRTPRLHGVDAWLFGRVVGRHDAGDHLGLVLAPQRLRVPRRVRLLGAQDLPTRRSR
jgi:flavin reductase (DIM6/NTAB) family NADH-FMN oxidoreductase RutF